VASFSELHLQWMHLSKRSVSKL